MMQKIKYKFCQEVTMETRGHVAVPPMGSVNYCFRINITNNQVLVSFLQFKNAMLIIKE